MQHTYTVQYELHHHCHWDTYVYILHMHICKNPCHVYGCTSMKEAWWGDNCFIARRVSTCARERSLKTLKWVQLLPGKGAKFFGSAIFQFIILAEGSWNKLQWFFCTCSQSAPYFMYIFSQVFEIEKPKRLCILEVWSLTCADNDLHVPERPIDLTYLPELRVNPCCFQSKPWAGVVKEECVWSREHPEELEEGWAGSIFFKRINFQEKGNKFFSSTFFILPIV